MVEVLTDPSSEGAGQMLINSGTPKVDAWVCPKCFRVHTELGAHIKHLESSEVCMVRTLDLPRRSGMCYCNGSRMYCTCSYAVKMTRR